MVDPVAFPVAPAGGGWDVEFTRLAREVQGGVRSLVQDLTARFQAAGLDCDVRIQQTPRGLSTFMALVGQRGLLCIVDLTVIDGMKVAQVPGAALDIRLLDACGDPVARRPIHRSEGAPAYQATANDILAVHQVGPCASAIHLLVMGIFGLPTAMTRGSGRTAA